MADELMPTLLLASDDIQRYCEEWIAQGRDPIHLFSILLAHATVMAFQGCMPQSKYEEATKAAWIRGKEVLLTEMRDLTWQKNQKVN